MIVEDNINEEQINEIFKYWNPEEILLYYNLMLQQIDDEKNIIEDNMWQQPTYKSVFEEVEDLLRQRGTVEDPHQQLNKIKFESYNKKGMLKQFRGYRIWKKRRRKVEVNF